VRTHVRGRSALWAARISTLSVFGPYLSGSVKAEDIVVLGLLFVTVMVGWPVMTRHSFYPFPIAAAWLGILVVMTLGALWRPADLGMYGGQAASHGVAAFVLPLAFMLLTWFWSLTAATADLIRDIARIIVAAMSVNSLIAVAQLAAGRPQISGLLPHFWSGATVAASVASSAAENGRYTGIFNQPADAGTAYGLALFCVIYLTRRAARPKWNAVWAIAALLLVGGVLSLSKTFVLGALPITAVVVARRHRARLRVISGGAFAGAAVCCLAALHLLPAWPDGTAAARGLVSGGSLTSQVSGLRYGTGGSLGPVVADVLRSSPLTGFGAGGLNTPYDSLWVEALAVAGIVGVVLMAAVLALLWLRWTRQREVVSPAQHSLAGAALALAAGASLGIPSLTSDPAAAMLWLVMGVLITAQPTRQRRPLAVAGAAGRPATAAPLPRQLTP
jgi:hypothetical protein